MSRTVHVLFDDPDSTGEYRHVCETGLSTEESDDFAMRWWFGSARSVLLAVVDEGGGTPLMVYERKVDAERLPEGWNYRYKSGGVRAVEISPDRREEVLRPDLGPDPAPPPVAPGSCPVCHLEPDPALQDADAPAINRSPSGRIANHRCPWCGMVLPGEILAVEARYVRFVSSPTPQPGDQNDPT